MHTGLDCVFGELASMSNEVTRALTGLGTTLLFALSTGTRVATKQERPAAMIPHVFALVGFGITLLQSLDEDVVTLLTPFTAPAAGFGLGLLYLSAIAVVIQVARRRRSPWRLVMPVLYVVCFTGIWWPSITDLPAFFSAFVLSMVGLVSAVILSRRRPANKAAQKATPRKFSVS